MAISAVIQGFVQKQFGPGVEATLVPLRGGLEAQGISRVLIGRSGRSIGSFVAKPFSGAAARELEVYRLLNSTGQKALAPALLGFAYTNSTNTEGYMFLEWVRAERRWPWADLHSSSVVIKRLAALHQSDFAPFSAAVSTGWDYERELSDSAASTVETYRRASSAGVRPGERPMLTALERVVGALPKLRKQLLSFTGTTLLHGDAHPGNVVLKRRTALLLDWERARIGSPLEDVASWVHSLSFWEWEAKRKHDTFLRQYRIACGASSPTLSSDFRDACILAGASNALAGALRYHLVVLQHPERTPREKYDSYRAAADWLRIIRRADVCFGHRCQR